MAKERIIGFKIEVEGSEVLLKTIGQLEQAIKDTNAELKDTEVGTERYKQLTKQLAGAKKQMQDVRKEQRLAMKEFEGVQVAEGSYKQLSSRLVSLKKEFRELGAEAREGIAGQELTKQIQDLDKELKGLDKQLVKVKEEFQEVGKEQEQAIKEAEVVQVAEGSYKQLSLRLISLKKEFQELGSEARDGVGGQELIAEIQAIDAELKGLNKQFVKEKEAVQDADGSYKQLSSRLILLKKEFQELGGEAREGVGGQELIKQIQELDAQIKGLNKQFVKEKEVVQDADGSYKELSSRLVLLKKEFQELGSEAREGAGGQELIKQIQELDAELKGLNKQFVKEKEAVQVADGSYKQLSSRLTLLKKEFQELGEEAREGIAGQELISEIQAIDKQLKGLNKQFAGTKEVVQFADGSYKQLNARLVMLKDQFRKMGAEAREGVGGQQLIAEIQKLDKELKGLDTTIGQSQRNIGNYSSAFDGLGGAIGGGISGLASFAFGAAGLGAAADILISGAEYVAALAEEFRVLRGELERLTGATGSELDSFTVRLKSISDVFSVGTDEIRQSAVALSKELGISFGDALTAIEKGFIAGANANGEFLDSLSEYSTQAREAGLSTAEFVSILNESGREGVFSDKGIDTVKEFGLRIREQTKATSDALINAFGEDFTNELFDGINSGATTTTDALQQVIGKLQDTELPANQVQTILADVFGGAGEDAGLRFISTLGNINDNINELSGSTSQYAIEQEKIFELTKNLNAAQLELSKEISGGSKEFQNLSTIVQTVVIERFTQLIQNLKFIATGIGNVVGGVRDFIGENEILNSTIGVLIRGFLGFWNITSVIFTQNLPAAFAGFRAAVTQTVDNVKIGLNDLALAAEIAAQKLNLALSINSDTREQIKQDIERLEGLRTTAAASAVSIGEAYNKAFQETIAKQKLEAPPPPPPPPPPKPTKPTRATKAGQAGQAGQEKEIEKITKLQLEGVDLLQRKKIEAFKIDQEAEDAAIAKKLQNIETEANATFESDRATREAIAENEEAIRQQKEQFVIQAAQELSDTLFQIAANRAQREQDAELEKLKIQEEAELAQFEGNEAKQLEIQAKFDKKREALEIEADKKAKRRAIAQAVINGALAVTKILADVPKADFGISTGILIAAAAVTTAAQIALISSQKFAQGGVLRGPSHAQGGIPTPFGEMEGGEAVINKRSTAMYKPLLSAINAAGGGVSFQMGGIAGAPLPIPSIQGGNNSDGLFKLAFLLKEENDLTRQMVSALQNQILNIRVGLDTAELSQVQATKVEIDNARTL